MKRFLIVTSFLEGATGLAMMTAPSLVIKLLLGSPLTDPIAIIITRVAGSALVSLGIACWFSRKSESVKGLIIALLFYNLASVALLGYAGLHENLTGIALWPAVAAHIVMAAWCTKLIFGTKTKYSKLEGTK